MMLSTCFRPCMFLMLFGLRLFLLWLFFFSAILLIGKMLGYWLFAIITASLNPRALASSVAFCLFLTRAEGYSDGQMALAVLFYAAANLLAAFRS